MWIISVAGISKHTWELENSVDLSWYFQEHFETRKQCGSWQVLTGVSKLTWNWKTVWIMAGISKLTWKLENSVDLSWYFQAHLEQCGS